MDTILKIGTLNLQNSHRNRNSNFSSDIARHIENEQFDILGTQELTRNYQKDISNRLSNYHFYGGYRYGSTWPFQKMKLLHNVNENNNIITHFQIENEYTLMLPFIPDNQKEFVQSIYNRTIMPRIVTAAFIKLPEDTICMLNTHLDYGLPSIQKKQLQALKNLVLHFQKTYPIIITGDFNMESSSSSFKDFCSDLNQMKRVEVNDSTHINHHSAIDHIFIPKEWIILEQGVKELPFTDHKEVFVKVKK